MTEHEGGLRLNELFDNRDPGQDEMRSGPEPAAANESAAGLSMTDAERAIAPFLAWVEQLRANAPEIGRQLRARLDEIRATLPAGIAEPVEPSEDDERHEAIWQAAHRAFDPDRVLTDIEFAESYDDAVQFAQDMVDQFAARSVSPAVGPRDEWADARLCDNCSIPLAVEETDVLNCADCVERYAISTWENARPRPSAAPADEPREDVGSVLREGRDLTAQDVRDAIWESEYDLMAVRLNRVARPARSVSPDDAAAEDLAPLLSPAGGDRWDAEGGTVRLGREEWGTVVDGLVELRASAARRKAANSESTSDLRVELIDHLIRRLSSDASAAPDVAPATTETKTRTAYRAVGKNSAGRPIVYTEYTAWGAHGTASGMRNAGWTDVAVESRQVSTTTTTTAWKAER